MDQLKSGLLGMHSHSTAAATRLGVATKGLEPLAHKIGITAKDTTAVAVAHDSGITTLCGNNNGQPDPDAPASHRGRIASGRLNEILDHESFTGGNSRTTIRQALNAVIDCPRDAGYNHLTVLVTTSMESAHVNKPSKDERQRLNADVTAQVNKLDAMFRTNPKTYLVVIHVGVLDPYLVELSRRAADILKRGGFDAQLSVVEAFTLEDVSEGVVRAAIQFVEFEKRQNTGEGQKDLVRRVREKDDPVAFCIFFQRTQDILEAKVQRPPPENKKKNGCPCVVM